MPTSRRGAERQRIPAPITNFKVWHSPIRGHSLHWCKGGLHAWANQRRLPRKQRSSASSAKFVLIHLRWIVKRGGGQMFSVRRTRCQLLLHSPLRYLDYRRSILTLLNCRSPSLMAYLHQAWSQGQPTNNSLQPVFSLSHLLEGRWTHTGRHLCKRWPSCVRLPTTCSNWWESWRPPCGRRQQTKSVTPLFIINLWRGRSWYQQCQFPSELQRITLLSTWPTFKASWMWRATSQRRSSWTLELPK